ncbi:MAG: hypothetical protein GY847_07950 [Proteobacteria bacterium]|nr:hypothetical protein [Pseudomonadota bacterium]
MEKQLGNLSGDLAFEVSEGEEIVKYGKFLAWVGPIVLPIVIAGIPPSDLLGFTVKVSYRRPRSPIAPITRI